MKTIKNFMVTSKDLNKIISRGCRVCRNNNFKNFKLRDYSICMNCGTKYFIASEALLDECNKQFTNIEVYRSGNIIGDVPPYNSELEIKRINYKVRKKDNIKVHSTK